VATHVMVECIESIESRADTWDQNPTRRVLISGSKPYPIMDNSRRLKPFSVISSVAPFNPVGLDNSKLKWPVARWVFGPSFATISTCRKTSFSLLFFSFLLLVGGHHLQGKCLGKGGTRSFFFHFQETRAFDFRPSYEGSKKKH